MSHRLSWLGLALSMVGSTHASDEGASHWLRDNLVYVDGGSVTGVLGASPGVRVFKGIPYAAPPVGELRWRAPQPVKSWEGARRSDTFSAGCAQPPLQSTNIYYDGPHPTSEDCLYLNVWTAARSSGEHHPVLLWIHDGALRWGEGSRPAYDGEALSKKGLVVVTINYRLGVFGMLAHPELSRESEKGVSGNYGLLDMIAAIKWTRRNIAAFGGDPERITLFGESVGARAVSALSTSPLVKGDIHGVIASDTLFIGDSNLADAERAGVEFAKAAGAASIDDLRKMSADDLIAASSKYQGPSFEFVNDHWALSGDIFAAEKSGSELDIPILTGSTADHATAAIFGPISAGDFAAQARKTYGELSDRFLALYPSSSDDEATVSERFSFNDSVAWTHDEWAAAHTKSGHRAYLYYFTHAIPPPPNARTPSGGLLPKRLGAFHTGEIPYAFDSLAKLDRPWTADDRQLADIMSSYWANFAATGNPNGSGLPRWPAYGDVERPVMELGDRVRPIHRVLGKAKEEFWTDSFIKADGK